MNNDAVIALTGAVVGAVATFIPTYWMERLKMEREARIVTESIVAEISAALFIFDKRKYLDSIAYILNSLRANRGTTERFRVVVPDDYCRIFKSQAQHVALLPDSIRCDVVRFHQLLEAAIADVRPGGLLAENDCGIREFENLYEIACDVKLTGERIVEIYSRKKAECFTVV